MDFSINWNGSENKSSHSFDSIKKKDAEYAKQLT